MLKDLDQAVGDSQRRAVLRKHLPKLRCTERHTLQGEDLENAVHWVDTRLTKGRDADVVIERRAKKEAVRKQKAKEQSSWAQSGNAPQQIRNYPVQDGGVAGQFAGGEHAVGWSPSGSVSGLVGDIAHHGAVAPFGEENGGTALPFAPPPDASDREETYTSALNAFQPSVESAPQHGVLALDAVRSGPSHNNALPHQHFHSSPQPCQNRAPPHMLHAGGQDAEVRAAQGNSVNPPPLQISSTEDCGRNLLPSEPMGNKIATFDGDHIQAQLLANNCSQLGRAGGISLESRFPAGESASRQPHWTSLDVIHHLDHSGAHFAPFQPLPSGNTQPGHVNHTNSSISPTVNSAGRDAATGTLSSSSPHHTFSPAKPVYPGGNQYHVQPTAVNGFQHSQVLQHSNTHSQAPTRPFQDAHAGPGLDRSQPSGNVADPAPTVRSSPYPELSEFELQFDEPFDVDEWQRFIDSKEPVSADAEAPSQAMHP